MPFYGHTTNGEARTRRCLLVPAAAIVSDRVLPPPRGQTFTSNQLLVGEHAAPSPILGDRRMSVLHGVGMDVVQSGIIVPLGANQAVGEACQTLRPGVSSSRFHWVAFRCEGVRSARRTDASRPRSECDSGLAARPRRGYRPPSRLAAQVRPSPLPPTRSPCLRGHDGLVCVAGGRDDVDTVGLLEVRWRVPGPAL